MQKFNATITLALWAVVISSFTTNNKILNIYCSLKFNGFTGGITTNNYSNANISVDSIYLLIAATLSVIVSTRSPQGKRSAAACANSEKLRRPSAGPRSPSMGLDCDVKQYAAWADELRRSRETLPNCLQDKNINYDSSEKEKSQLVVMLTRRENRLTVKPGRSFGDPGSLNYRIP